MAKVAKPSKAAPVAGKPAPRTLQPHELVLSPVAQNAIGMDAWGRFAGAADLAGLVKDLRERIEQVQAGDMSSVEAMLYGQAMTLQTMFTSLARQAASETGLKQYQAKLTFALKAQAQCRSTLEALAEIKNPRPVSFVKQANISNGPQQVNNGGTQASTRTPAYFAHAHTETFESQQNKLLESQHGNYLDTGAQGQAGRANPHMATVEAGQRA
jgi:hypothetical protein